MMPIRSIHDEDSPESIRNAYARLQRELTDTINRIRTWRRLDAFELIPELEAKSRILEMRLRIAAAALDGGHLPWGADR